MFKKAGLEKISAQGGSARLAGALANRASGGKFSPKLKKISPSGLHQLADEMQIYFGGRFALYAKIIKTVGEQQAREWFSDSKTSKHPIKRFLYLYREFMRKIIWR